MSDTPGAFFASREDSTGRRYRWTVPWARVGLAGCLFLAGFILSIAGLALGSFEVGIPGLFMLLPGAWASRVYAGVLYHGEEATRPDVFFEQLDEV